MALGREVADAYISVHGDLAPFRKDLSGAEADARKAAIENADAFSDAWGKRVERDVSGQWNNIVDAMYKNDKINWERLLGDTSKIDETFTDLTDLMSDMVDEGKLLDKQFNDIYDTMGDVVGKMKERSKIEEQYGQALRENAAYDDRRLKTMEAANKENERWARTWDGIRKNNAISGMESDFRRLAQSMDSADMGAFAKSFDNLHQARARIYEITAAMEQQNRLTREQSEAIQASMNLFIDAETAKSKAMKDSLDQTNKLRAAQDRYNQSLSGMARNIHFGKMEGDFRNLAAAMDSQDWSVFERGARSTAEMRDNIRSTAAEMHRLGRMTDQEYALILDRVERVNGAFRSGGNDGGNFFRVLSGGAGRFNNAMRGLNNATRGFREHLQGFAGLNVFGDMVRGGLDFIHNLDRIALGISKTSTLLGSMASIGGSSLAGLIVIAADLGATLGGLAAVAPAFLVGAGIGVGVLVAAFKDMKTVLADLKPAFASLQDNISGKFWKEAAAPIREMVTGLMPTLNTQLGNTGTAFGSVFGKLATAIDKVPKEDIVTMFERMNKGIEIAGDAMAPLTRAFKNLGLAGSKTFERFGKWVVKLSDQFDSFIQTAFDNGSIDRWIENMISGFKDIGRSMDGVFGIFNAIDSAARRAGSGGLKEFADKLQGLAAAMQSSRFQNTLTTLLLGMNTAVSKIGQSIRNLGPALESAMPSIQRALVDIGTVAARVIDYFGMILNNPVVQRGITDFTNSMVKAINQLEPAIKPFGDSLGTMLSLLGKITESVSQIATTFFVELSPVLDDMSRKLETLVKPLADGASKFITDMKGPLEALNTQFVGPLVDAINTKLLPAITGPGGFSEEFAKFVTRIVDAAGPSFTTLVDRVLPALVTVVTELLDPLGKFVAFFTPTLNKLLGEAATGFENIGKALKILKGEIPITELEIFKPGAMEKSAAKAEQDFKNAWENRQGMSWGDIFAKIIGGKPDEAGQAFGIMWTEKIFPGIRDVWENVIIKGIKMIFEGRAFGDEVKKNLDDFWRDDASIGADFDKSVNEWFTKNVFEPLGKLGESIGKLWDETLGKFFDGIFGSGGQVSGGGGGGAGGKGMGVTGKLDPKMLGLPDEEGTRGWFEQFGTWLWEGFTGALGRLGEVLGLNEFGTKWTEFWDTLPVKVQEVWDSIVLWVQTKAGEIKLAVDTFIADTQLNWTTFWDTVPVKVQEVWDAVLLWIQTKAAEIKLGIDTWIAALALNWGLFWDGVKTKVEEIWNAVKTWIETKATEIKTNIDTFISDVKSNWDNFWTGVRNKVTEIWNAVTSWISSKVGEIKNNIDRFIGDVRSNWENFWNGLGDKVRNAWSDMVRGVQQGVQDAVNWVTGMPGRISAALSGFGNLLLGAGAAIMEGFKRGLENAWEGVKNFVGGIANWIAENKGPISYDRTLLEPAGEAIMGGLHRSLRAGFGKVMGTVETMADTVASAFAHSKMYLAGADAALGLADGLKSERGTLANVLGSIIPDASLSAKISPAGTGGVGTPTPSGKVVNVAEGAITIVTPTKDPQIVAEKAIDALVINSNL